jgi:3-dehydrotetronate 4-kinase
VFGGAASIQARFEALSAAGYGVAVVDAIRNEDLMTLGLALKDMALVTGGSGLALGLPQNWGLGPNTSATQLTPARGERAVVCGSCSQTSMAQVAHFMAQGLPSLRVDAVRAAQGEPVVDEAVQWARAQPKGQPVLIYSSTEPDALKAVQQQLGAERAGAMMEQVLAQIAKALVAMGVGRLIVAGGETSGACVQALGISQMQIGPQIDPGVPWCQTVGPAPIHVALKSGNFGSVDFFTKAFAQINE